MGLSFVLETSAKLLGRLSVPFKGTWKTLPSHLLPPDVLTDSLNVVIQSGELVSRAGLEPFDSFPTSSPVLGSMLYLDGMNKYPIAATATKVYLYNGGWGALLGPTLATPANSPIRFTLFSTGSTFYFVLANGDKLYYGNTGPYQELTPFLGSLLPSITDITSSFNRLVMISPPYSIAWTNALTIFEAPVLNTVFLADTPDPLVAIRNLGTLGFVVYKEASIYTAFAQGATSAAAFRFEFRGTYEGPANPNAVVDANGVHYGFTPSGRVFRFDGSRHDFIADGLWPTLREDIDSDYLHKIHGVYNYKTHEIYFWYPRVGDEGEVKGMLLINLPYPLSGVENFSYFLGSSAFSCTNSLGTALFQNIQSSFVFGNSYSYRLNHNHFFDAEGNEIPIRIQPGFISPQDQSIVQAIYQYYLRRGEGKGTISVHSIVSNMLETNMGESSQEEIIDLTTIVPNEYISTDSQGSFISFRIEANASDRVSYLGADIYGITTM